MERRRAANVVSEIMDQKTGSSPYSRMDRIHMSAPYSAMSAGSTLVRRCSTHVCISSACSRTGGRSW